MGDGNEIIAMYQNAIFSDIFVVIGIQRWCSIEVWIVLCVCAFFDTPELN